MAQVMPLPFTVSCFCKIQIGFTFLVLADLGSPRKRAVKHVCACPCTHARVGMCVCVCVTLPQQWCEVLYSVCLCVSLSVCLLTDLENHIFYNIWPLIIENSL